MNSEQHQSLEPNLHSVAGLNSGTGGDLKGLFHLG